MSTRYNLYNLEAPFKKYLLAGKENEQMTQVTINNYLSDFRHFVGWFTSVGNETILIQDTIALITYELVNQYKNYLQANKLPIKSINRRLSSLRKFCSFCISQNWLKENPAKKVANVVVHREWARAEPLANQEQFKQSKEPIAEINNDTIDHYLTIINNIREYIYREPHFAYFIGFSIFLIFIIVIGIVKFIHPINNFSQSLNYASGLKTANRYISFHGKLTDNLKNPIITPTQVSFKLWNTINGGENYLYTSGTCSITPDQNGIFSSIIGQNCGSAINAAIFIENANVYLGITIGGDEEMNPRQQITNVGYALNTETLQGFPPGTEISNLPYINKMGDVLISAADPGIRSINISANFVITSANSVTIQSAGTGDITLDASESGSIKLQTANLDRINITSDGKVNMSSLNSGGLVKASVITGALSTALSGIDYENPLTFNNGLIRSLDTIKLGGTLIEDTNIPLNGKSLTFSGNGMIGIGTSNPLNALDVSGNASLSGTLSLAPNVSGYVGTCNSASAGKMYFNGTNNKFYYCNGSSWNDLTGATGSTGLLSSGSVAGNTPYWDGTQWVTNSSNIFNNGTVVKFLNVGSSTAANDLRITSDGTLTTDTSDITMKTNINPLTSVLDRILSLNTYLFNWKDHPDGKKEVGMIAQEVSPIFNEVTFINPVDNKMGINYSRFVTILIKAIQEQQIYFQSQINKINQEKIISPIIETKDIVSTGEASLNKITTNVIKPQNNDLMIDLSLVSPTPTDKGKLAKLIIKGLAGKTVTEIDSEGNATFSGTLIADKILARNLEANNASISGTLTAKEVVSDNINNLSTNVNDIQKLLAEIKNQPLPNPDNYQNIDKNITPPGTNLQHQFEILEANNLTVTGNSNLYNLTVSNSLMAGNLLMENNSILSLAWELKLSSLSTINFFDNAIVMAKDGSITTRGTLIAQAGIRTNEIKGLTDQDEISINNIAINNLTIKDKYSDATTSANIIAASDNFEKNGIFTPAIVTQTQIAGIGIVPKNSLEVIIYNSNIKDNSLIYLTPNNNIATSGLTVTKKESCSNQSSNCKPYFKVGIENISNNDIQFNWLVIN